MYNTVLKIAAKLGNKKAQKLLEPPHEEHKDEHHLDIHDSNSPQHVDDHHLEMPDHHDDAHSPHHDTVPMIPQKK